MIQELRDVRLCLNSAYRTSWALRSSVGRTRPHGVIATRCSHVLAGRSTWRSGAAISFRCIARHGGVWFGQAANEKKALFNAETKNVSSIGSLGPAELLALAGFRFETAPPSRPSLEVGPRTGRARRAEAGTQAPEPCHWIARIVPLCLARRSTCNQLQFSAYPR